MHTGNLTGKKERSAAALMRVTPLYIVGHVFDVTYDKTNKP
jgi:hypothetical protein